VWGHVLRWWMQRALHSCMGSSASILPHVLVEALELLTLQLAGASSTCIRNIACRCGAVWSHW
jgi:hypothetical protein